MTEPQPQISLEEARRRADAKRDAFTEATEALKTRVVSDAEEVNALVVRAKSTLTLADEMVRGHHLVALTAAVVFGLTMGRRGGRRRKRERLLEEGQQAIVISKPPKKPSLFGSLVATVAGAVAKQVALRIVESLQKPED